MYCLIEVSVMDRSIVQSSRNLCDVSGCDHEDSIRRWPRSIREGCTTNTCKKVKGTAVPLQAWSGPEGSRKLRFPDFVTTAQEGGKAVSPMHRPPLPPEILLVLISVRG